MRQINSLLIFVICLALVLFSIQNTEIVSIHVMQGIDFTAPLAIELLIAMGIGAMMAWVFSVWSRLQQLLIARREIKQRDTQIKTLETTLADYKRQIEEQQPLLAAAQAAAPQDAIES